MVRTGHCTFFTNGGWLHDQQMLCRSTQRHDSRGEGSARVGGKESLLVPGMQWTLPVSVGTSIEAIRLSMCSIKSTDTGEQSFYNRTIDVGMAQTYINQKQLDVTQWAISDGPYMQGCRQCYWDMVLSSHIGSIATTPHFLFLYSLYHPCIFATVVESFNCSLVSFKSCTYAQNSVYI